MRTVHISASPASIGSARTYVPQFDQDTETRSGCQVLFGLFAETRSGSQQHCSDTFRPEACWLDKHSVHRQKSDRIAYILRPLSLHAVEHLHLSRRRCRRCRCRCSVAVVARLCRPTAAGSRSIGRRGVVVRIEAGGEGVHAAVARRRWRECEPDCGVFRSAACCELGAVHTAYNRCVKRR
jgi:hypothetical protein